VILLELFKHLDLEQIVLVALRGFRVKQTWTKVLLLAGLCVHCHKNGHGKHPSNKLAMVKTSAALAAPLICLEIG
jgi:hypothetical protein